MREIITIETSPSRIVNNTMQQGIYQYALPHCSERVDICTLDSKREKAAQDFIDSLLKTGVVDMEIHSTFQAANQLRHLFFESRNREKLTGDKSLAVGFPLLFTRLDNEIWASPLFLWRISMEPSINRVNSWVIRHNDSHPVEANYQLLDHLNKAYLNDFSDTILDFGNNDQLRFADVQRICETLVERLDLQYFQKNGRVQGTAQGNEIKDLAYRGAIVWSGVIGLFDPQWKMEALPSIDFPVSWDKQVLPSFTHPFGLFTQTPTGIAALEKIQEEPITVVKNRANKAKIQLIAQLLTNALANGQKCLVIGEQVTTLRAIQQLLTSQQLDQLYFTLKEPATDKSLLLELLKALSQNDTHPPLLKPPKYSALVEKCLRLKNVLDEQYQTIHKPIFAQQNWTHLVGRFLKSNRIEGKELLNSQLQPQDFTFISKEYQILKTSIEICKPLYQNISTLKHPLGDLNAAIFTEKTEGEGLKFIQEKTAYFLKRGEAIQLEYIKGQQGYSERLRTHYDKRQRELQQKVKQVQETIEEYTNEFGQQFMQASPTALKIKGWISSTPQQILTARITTQEQFRELKDLYAQNDYFYYEFPIDTSTQNIVQIKGHLKRFLEELNAWQLRINDEVQESMQRLSYQTALPNLEYRNHLKQLEEQLDGLIEEINETKLLENRITNKMLTLAKQQRFLEDVLEQMEGTRYNLRDFTAFYQWHRNWLLLDIKSRKVVKALVKVKPNNWQAAFESWYFNQLLLKYQSTNLPNREEDFLNFYENYEVLKPLLRQQLLFTWEQRKESAVKQLKAQNKKVYNLIFGKKNHQLSEERNLPEILKLGLNAITEVQPILFTTAAVAAHDLPKVKEHFDYLIFADAEEVKYETALPSIGLGKRVVILGDVQFGEGKPVLTLLDYVQQQRLPSITLETPPLGVANAALRFHNNLFDPLFDLTLVKEPALPTSLRVEHVEGRFNEKEGTNDVEAQHILTLLNNIKPTQQRTYPKVGIACFTPEQRNLLAAYLLKIKQKRSSGSEMIQQLERNGLGVYTLEELVGQHFDILIISITYGTIDMHGTLTRELGQVSQNKNLEWLRLLTSSAGQQLVLVNSLPLSDLENYLSKPEELGTFLLASLLEYAQSVQNHQAEQQFYNLQQLQTRAPLPAFDMLMAEEICAGVLPYLGGDRLATNVVFNGIRIPLLILPIKDNQPATAVIPDGYFSKDTLTAYEWERAQQLKLEEMNFLYYPAWSVKWWRNPEQEARKLASWVIKVDGE